MDGAEGGGEGRELGGEDGLSGAAGLVVGAYLHEELEKGLDRVFDLFCGLGLVGWLSWGK